MRLVITDSDTVRHAPFRFTLSCSLYFSTSVQRQFVTYFKSPSPSLTGAIVSVYQGGGKPIDCSREIVQDTFANILNSMDWKCSRRSHVRQIWPKESGCFWRCLWCPGRSAHDSCRSCCYAHHGSIVRWICSRYNDGCGTSLWR